MQFESLEKRNLMCGDVLPTTFVEFEQVGDWRRGVTLGAEETYELRLKNNHDSCSVPVSAGASNYFGAIFSEGETTFESWEHAVDPASFDGTLEPQEEVRIRMTSRPKLSDFNSPDDPGQSIAEVLVSFGDTGDFAQFSIIGQLVVMPGDADSDGKVGFRDFLIFSANYGKQTDDFFAGDFDRNGVIDLDDFELLVANYGRDANKDDT